MDKAEVVGGIAALLPGDVHMMCTNLYVNHENTARRPNDEVLPAYAKIGLAQSFKPAPQALGSGGRGLPTASPPSPPGKGGGGEITLSKQVKNKSNDQISPRVMNSYVRCHVGILPNSRRYRNNACPSAHCNLCNFANSVAEIHRRKGTEVRTPEREPESR